LWAQSVSVRVQLLMGEYPTLRTSENAAEKLLQSIEVIEHWAEQAMEQKFWDDPDEAVDAHFNHVIEDAKALEHILEEELPLLPIFYPRQKLIYSTLDLIEHADESLPESIRLKLKDGILAEIRESGKCLVFDVPTAGGFHILRATEAVMHEYYLVLCKPKTKERLTSWAAYTTILYKQSNREDVPEDDKEHIKRALSLLYQIKEDRNLLMHPEIVLKADEALTLFDYTKAIIGTMAEKLPKRRQKD